MSFILNEKTGYFQNHGVDVMAFDDIYPEGHQSGVSIIMHGQRMATNGDVRLEQTPGQWQPLPKPGLRQVNAAENTITTHLHYPDMDRHLRGFNPMLYPDVELDYTVSVHGEGSQVRVTVSLEKPVPADFLGKVCFNLELFPGELFGKPWLMDDQQGIFPMQPNGPTLSVPSNYSRTDMAPLPDSHGHRKELAGEGKDYNPLRADDVIAAPYAVGRRFTLRPEEPLRRVTVESLHGQLKLYDGRMNHNNGWFVLSTEIPAGRTEKAVEWLITPSVVEEWRYQPVVQVSQVGYAPGQPKVAVIETDRRETDLAKASLWRIGESGPEEVCSAMAEVWGSFLRYRYLQFDFSHVRTPGMYQVRYGASQSAIFRIGEDVYDRGVWQPVLEYFLPVQMCHMRVAEKYRVWHGLCHDDDARMAPVNYVNFDGYIQGPSTLTQYASGQHVPGLNVGGWHDAGDFDLRVESQAGEAYILALAYECFGVDYDVTTIDQGRKVVEIHQPDGKNDILQQVEHGTLTVLAGWKALGRLYRGIICGDLRQYVMLGDASNMTDNRFSDDDRWVFTEDNPLRELSTAAQLAGIARALKDFNAELAAEALQAARELWHRTPVENERARMAKVHAAAELLLTTGEEAFRSHLLAEKDFIIQHIHLLGWIAARCVETVDDAAFAAAVRQAMGELKQHLEHQSAETPYGIPYRPHIWGAGWEIQRRGFEYYFLHRAYPDIFSGDMLFSTLNFILGCHPGSNTASFASGVGAKSATMAYGMNRADRSFIPGGVVSGTALIRPDFPELLEWPFLWQQTEYVLGGGSSNYMFLVLAVRQLLGR